MIHSFEELKRRYQKDVEHRYAGAAIDGDTGFDGADEIDPGDEFLASATPDELMRLLETERGSPAIDPAPADEASSTEEPDRYLDYDLSQGDVTKLT